LSIIVIAMPLGTEVGASFKNGQAKKSLILASMHVFCSLIFHAWLDIFRIHVQITAGSKKNANSYALEIIDMLFSI
jgi:hypothetical protein